MNENTWKETVEKMKIPTCPVYKIRNSQTGAYVCDIYGRTKLFSTKNSAVSFIEFRRLKDIYKIEMV